MPFSQAQRKHPVALDLYAFQQVRLELEFAGVADQAGVTVNDDLADILLFAHQQTQFATVVAEALIRGQFGDLIIARQALRYGRQFATVDAGLQRRRFLQSECDHRAARQQHEQHQRQF